MTLYDRTVQVQSGACLSRTERLKLVVKFSADWGKRCAGFGGNSVFEGGIINLIDAAELHRFRPLADRFHRLGMSS